MVRTYSRGFSAAASPLCRGLERPVLDVVARVAPLRRNTLRIRGGSGMARYATYTQEGEALAHYAMYTREGEGVRCSQPPACRRCRAFPGGCSCRRRCRAAAGHPLLPCRTPARPACGGAPGWPPTRCPWSTSRTARRTSRRPPRSARPLPRQARQSRRSHARLSKRRGSPSQMQVSAVTFLKLIGHHSENAARTASVEHRANCLRRTPRRSSIRLRA
eukprot:1821309-Pyramimonas_sp.AAC.1